MDTEDKRWMARSSHSRKKPEPETKTMAAIICVWHLWDKRKKFRKHAVNPEASFSYIGHCNFFKYSNQKKLSIKRSYIQVTRKGIKLETVKTLDVRCILINDFSIFDSNMTIKNRIFNLSIEYFQKRYYLVTFCTNQVHPQFQVKKTFSRHCPSNELISVQSTRMTKHSLNLYILHIFGILQIFEYSLHFF